ncbi:MAG: OsmC family peroxiredoxin [Ignavibacteriales bacterium]|nr:OsmC family peroxiredoxin [Ignavibacteriales bacterium]
MSDEKHTYETTVAFSGEKIGELTSEGLPNIEVASPPEFQGAEGVWTPEHLFVASANVCLATTFAAIAKFSKLEYESYEAEATGTLERRDGKFEITKIEIRPTVVVTKERRKQRAERIVEKAEQACLVTRSMKTTVTAKPTIIVNES